MGSQRLPEEKQMSLQVERTSFSTFEESTAEDWAVIVGRRDATQALVADRVLWLMRQLEGDSGGFPVNRLEHSLQTASRAARDGRDDEYVLCALLHDIGDSVAPQHHPLIGAAIVKSFVSPANHWMVEHHGEFQGYYFWHHIGQDRHAREAHRGSPYFEHTEEFCAKYDQISFDSTYRSEPLEYFEPLIRTLLSPGA
jgi:predicted HD phosphohydrolase